MIMKLIDRFRLTKLVREKLKVQGKGKFRDSVKHAIDGVDYTVSHERNFKIELFFAVMVCIASILFHVSVVEWVVLLLTIAIVLCLEILNTAIERCVDLVTKDYRDLAKISKDAAAGAVFVMSIFSVCIGICIFLPKIIAFMREVFK